MRRKKTNGKTNPKAALIISVFLLAVWPAVAGGEIIYVRASASAGGNGQTWGTAYKYLQDALYKPPSGGDQIWVAAGTYKPDANSANPGGTGERGATFQLINDVALYGGFAGGETSLAQRDWQTNETILSGAINTPGDNSDNSYHVVTGSGTDATGVLDGFTITAGNANVWTPNICDDGGGMYNNSGSPTITNCTFSGNSANYGGGMHNKNYSSPTLTNCTFSGNSATNGSGMLNHFYSDPTLTNCTFTGNSASSTGGGMYNVNNSPTLTNCTFSGNSAANWGGGMYNQNNSLTLTNCTFSGNSHSAMVNWKSNPTVTNCTFSQNPASYQAGGMNNYYSSPTLTNCTFTGNSAGDNGGGMNNLESSPTLTNCILWGDTASDGNEIALYSSSTVDVNYSDVKGGQAGIYNDGTGTVNWGSGNIDADPLFFDANNPDPSLRDYHLRPGSPCIDTGDNNSIPPDTADLDGDGNTTEPIPFDIDTDVRISGGTVDMGSDEVIWDGAENIGPGESVTLNPGGGGTDPNTEALVVFDNNSVTDANITVVEMGSTAHPKVQGFQALGKTLRIETSLSGGEFFMTVVIPFDANDLKGAEPFTVDLMYWGADAGEWQHAVEANTDPQQSNPKGNRWQEEYPPDTAPTLAELKARGMGANGVFWNEDTEQGFVWANVDHTTDFEGLIHNIADFEPDGDVDFADYAWFAPNWMATGCGVCGGADLTGDGNVDWHDLQDFSDNWLAEL